MIRKAAKKELENINLLDLIPQRNSKWDVEDETVIILHPKFKNRFLVKTLLPIMGKPNWKIRLDDIGSWVWKQCDGKRTVREIGSGLKESFGDQVDPVYDRLSIFIKKLESSQFISFTNLPLQKK